MTATKLDDFTTAYIEAMLWSSTDDADRPMDANYSIDDLAPETLAQIVTDCEQFQTNNADVLSGAECNRGSGEYTTYEQAGHDFWLTRCGHGAARIPETWDGHELRQWVSDLTAQLYTSKMDRRRLAAYRNDCLVKNL